jgi:hypothetical protein
MLLRDRCGDPTDPGSDGYADSLAFGSWPPGTFPRLPAGNHRELFGSV